MDVKSFKETMVVFRHMAQNNIDANNAIDVIEKEFGLIEKINIKPNNTERKNLYKILHSTRALELSLKSFLIIFDALPDKKSEWTLGGYLQVLSRGLKNKFNALNGDLKRRYLENVVKNRNKYLHVAGNFPTPKMCKDYLNNVLSIMQTTVRLIIA